MAKKTEREGHYKNRGVRGQSQNIAITAKKARCKNSVLVH